MIGINCLRSSKPPLTIGSSGRGSRLRSAQEGVDDWASKRLRLSSSQPRVARPHRKTP